MLSLPFDKRHPASGPCQFFADAVRAAQKPAAHKSRFAQPFQRDLGRPVALSKIFRL